MGKTRMTVLVTPVIQPLWKTLWSLLMKLNIEPKYNPAISLLDLYPEVNEKK